MYITLAKIVAHLHSLNLGLTAMPLELVAIDTLYCAPVECTFDHLSS